jgi:hypothetical protein
MGNKRSLQIQGGIAMATISEDLSTPLVGAAFRWMRLIVGVVCMVVLATPKNSFKTSTSYRKISGENAPEMLRPVGACAT